MGQNPRESHVCRLRRLPSPTNDSSARKFQNPTRFGLSRKIGLFPQQKNKTPEKSGVRQQSEMAQSNCAIFHSVTNQQAIGCLAGQGTQKFH
jgi:hypothetical protein